MEIQIEDYSGNDLIKLDFNRVFVMHTANTFNQLDEIVNVYGYGIADFDEGIYRVQCHSRVETKDNLIKLISALTNQYLEPTLGLD